jgi:hypothetical protein
LAASAKSARQRSFAGVFSVNHTISRRWHWHVARKSEELIGLDTLAQMEIGQRAVLRRVAVSGGDIDAPRIVETSSVIADPHDLHSRLQARPPATTEPTFPKP